MSQRRLLPNSTAASSSRLWPVTTASYPPSSAAWSNSCRFDSPHAEHGTRSVARPPSARRSRSRRAGRSRAARARARRRSADVAAALVGVVADPEPDVQPVGRVAGLDEHVPQRERVLAAADRDEHAVVRATHLVVLDRLAIWRRQSCMEVLGTEVGVVARQVDDRRALADPALAADARSSSPIARRRRSPGGPRSSSSARGGRRRARACRCGSPDATRGSGRDRRAAG